MIEIPPPSPAVIEWMRTWAERNPEKHKRFLSQVPRDRYGRFTKRT